MKIVTYNFEMFYIESTIIFKNIYLYKRDEYYLSGL